MADGLASIRGALDLIRSTTIKSRSEGLSALKQVFRHTSHKSKVDAFDNDGYLYIFEALFKCVETERSLYLKASKSQLKLSAANRLSLCASALRVVVEAGVQKVNIKTIKALIDHIIDTLPHPENGHCEPLVDDYAKTLRVILDDQVHVEHLKPEKWLDTLELCIEAINVHIVSTELTGSLTPTWPASHATQSASGHGGRSFVQSGGKTSVSSSPATEFVMCVRRLVQASNACVNDSSEAILDTMLLYLRSTHNIGRGHHDAFAAINHVFARTRTNCLALTATYVEEVLPLITELWSSKRSSIREELLATLILVEGHIEHAIKHLDPRKLRDDLQRLSDTLARDFLRRPEKDMLHMEDLWLGTEESSVCSGSRLGTRCLTVKHARSEVAWMTVHFIAKFASLLAISAPSSRSALDGDLDMDGPNKRQRKAKPFDEYLNLMTHPTATHRLGALQVVALMLCGATLSVEELSDVFERLVLQLGDADPSISSWAMIALTECTQQDEANATQLQPRWYQVWHMVARSLPNARSSRCASLLLDQLLASHLIQFSAVSDAVEGMVKSAELNGPATLSDASLRLWSTLLRLRQEGNPTAGTQDAEQLLHWLFAHWNPHQLTNKAKSAADAALLLPNDLINVLYPCLGLRKPSASRAVVTILGPLSQTYVRVSQEHDVTRYLLKLDPTGASESNSSDKQGPADSEHNPHPAGHPHSLLLDLLLNESNSLLTSWTDFIAERMQSATPDIVRNCLVYCLVVFRLLALRELKVLPRSELVRKATDELALRVSNTLGRSECSQDCIDAALTVLNEALPHPSLLPSIQCKTIEQQGLLPISLYISGSLNERQAGSSSFTNHANYDSMDIDEDFDSQGWGYGQVTSFADTVRDDVGTASSIATLRTCVTAYLRMIVASVEATTLEESSEYIPTGFIKHLCDLDNNELYACRPLICAIAQSNLRLHPTDTITLLEHLAVAFLQEYDFERCEPAILCCLEALEGLATQWTQRKIDVNGIGDQIFNWASKSITTLGIASARVQMGFARVCYRLAELQYPSARITIFELFALGDCRVKFCTSSLIAAVLSRWKLAEHDEAFETLRKEHLPNDLTRREEIAMRLFVVSELASRWPTLRRKCVYSIYETAAAMSPDDRGYATLCVKRIAKSLDLDASPTFFRLFAPQLLYTWLGTDQLESAPYEIFGYSTLKSLIVDVEHEVTAQLVMRRKLAELERLSQSLGRSVTQLLRSSFPRCCAYAMSWDLLSPVSDSTESNSEMGLYTHLGADEYMKLITRHLHEIVGIMICTTSDVEQARKVLEKKKTYVAQSKRLAEILGLCASPLQLPPQQQPSFAVKFLPDVLERLCRRTSHSISELWTPSRLTYCLRMLFKNMAAAYGSLHSCACIRKIRLLVSLAGDVALTGYPLEQAIHGLYPYITDQYCAADAMGLVQYLYHRGRSHLQENGPFVAGSAASILLATRIFLDGTQDSTTQDSQFTTTKQNAQDFLTWFNAFLDQLAMQLKENTDRSRFRSLVRNSAQCTKEGGAYSGTAEAKLLFELLLDGESRDRMLDEDSRLALIDILQQDFRDIPPSSGDIVSSDEHARAFASQLMALIQRPGINPKFRAWAARTVGRAFTASGGSSVALQSAAGKLNLNNIFLEGIAETTNLAQRSCLLSRASVISIVYGVLRSRDPAEVAAAEEALRAIMARAAHDDETRHCVELTLPASVQTALYLADRGKSIHVASPHSIIDAGQLQPNLTVHNWIQDLTVALATSYPKDAILGATAVFIKAVGRMTERLFPFLLHLALFADFTARRSAAAQFAEVSRACYAREQDAYLDHNRILLRGLLYLRKQPVPAEENYNDRDEWLDIDYLQAARAAARCGWYNTALQLAETHVPAAPEISRRSSSIASGRLPSDLMIDIYRNLDDPDSFYGAPQEGGLHSVLERLDFEHDGERGLLFHGALVDSQIRRTGKIQPNDARAVVHSLLDLNLNGLAHITLSSSRVGNVGADLVTDTLEAARKLQQWDVKAPNSGLDASGIVFEAFQSIQGATSSGYVRRALESAYLKAAGLLNGTQSLATTSKALTALACLAEMDEVLSCTTRDSLKAASSVFNARHIDVRQTRYDLLQPILSSRQTLFSVLSNSESLHRIVGALPRDIRALEVRNILTSCDTARRHGAERDSLAAAIYLHDIVPSCQKVGLYVEARANFEVARVLWQKGEHQSSVRMLQRLTMDITAEAQSMAPGLPITFSTLASHVAEARLEAPKEIIDNYFQRAVRELGERSVGHEAGEVLHEFASFCDRQLHYSEGREEFVRLERLRKQRLEEYELLRNQVKSHKDRGEKHRLGRNLDAMKRWIRLDEEEYQRLRSQRETLIELSIENLLRSLHASDLHNDDVLRFLSLWFEFADLTLANDTALKYAQEVPSYKFIPIMNQLSSRLQAESSTFQGILSDLVSRVCVHHPFHGMYQIFSGANPQGIRDEASKSRQEATLKMSQRLATTAQSQRIWSAIHAANKIYNTAAMARSKDDFETGQEYRLDDVPVTQDVIRKIPKLKVPPITLHIEARSGGDYSDVPTIHHFKSTMKIAGGLSKPKIVIAVGSDGRAYRQLLKGGSDDLRQDTIMEQVFDQVSSFLKRHPATRQRDLLIRTYKVIPLSAVSGVIEFVPNTIPLNDVLLPVHEKYYPKDLRSITIRKQVEGARPDSNEARIKTFQDCINKFHPAMRYWFLENFPEPDEWYAKRLAYSRSTAASSILGYVMGLGDRHLHNILVDRKSGEVVHIDLGVAFEAGKVLPIPEIIPFRLTRDMVDGMGYSKTEGVFRRCCEFTLDTLRDEKESILTVVNVLRYDPLCTWTVSPQKARKMQDDIDEDDADRMDEIAEQASRDKGEDAGEAARALAVVERKLTKSLSTAATINELIQHATDERNLALLFAGWSAWV